MKGKEECHFRAPPPCAIGLAAVTVRKPSGSAGRCPFHTSTEIVYIGHPIVPPPLLAIARRAAIHPDQVISTKQEP